MKDKVAAAPRPCMGYMDAVRPKSHASSVSHPRLWDVRRGQSQQAVFPRDLLEQVIGSHADRQAKAL